MKIKQAAGPSVLMDVRPLQGPSSKRGVGSYATGLLKGMVDEGFDTHLTLLLDARLGEPELPAGKFKLAGSRRRYSGNFAATWVRNASAPIPASSGPVMV